MKEDIVEYSGKNNEDSKDFIKKLKRYAPFVYKAIQKVFLEVVENENNYRSLVSAHSPDSVYASQEVLASKKRMLDQIIDYSINLNYIHDRQNYIDLFLNMLILLENNALANLFYSDLEDRLGTTNNPIVKKSIELLLEGITLHWPNVKETYQSEDFYIEHMLNEENRSISTVLGSIFSND